MRTYTLPCYEHLKDWKFLPDPRYRDWCDHTWVMEFVGIDGQFHRSERRCDRVAKFQHGDILLCGYHTPGYGRKGPRSVPRDPPSAAKLRVIRESIDAVCNHLTAKGVEGE